MIMKMMKRLNCSYLPFKYPFNTIDDELIDLVEANPCLYNVKMEEYRNQTLKNGVWNQIADKLQLDVKSIKQKWKNIRSGYYTSLQKPASGSAAGRKRKYSRDLSFLKEFGVAQEGSSSRISSFPIGSDDSETTSQSIQSSLDGDLENFSAEESHEIIVETSDISPATEEKDRVLKQMDDLIKSIMAEKEPDSIDLFCDALKCDLRQVPGENLPLCKAQIMNVISENLARRQI
uniref:CSON009641 protein n=1 Tax=Culicoides sonorensis TaxID=179676 RepID=A0A336N2R1_CULSO